MNINEKLLKIQTELKAPKSKYNDFGNFNYRSCEDILEAVKPLLDETKSTLYISDNVCEIGGRIYVEATVCFVDLQLPDVQPICVKAFAREPLSKKKMDEAQITGTASSYARKYALNGLFLIDDVKDPDTNEYKTEIEKKSDISVLDEYVTAEQCVKLETLLKKADVTSDKFCEAYKISIISELPAKQFDSAVRKLETTIKAKGEKKDV